MNSFAKLISLAALAAAFVGSAKAESVEDFYKGKQLQFYIRAAPGGNYDLYSRLLGKYLTLYMPGHPRVMPYNMPGGGGIIALKYLMDVAPKDGTALTIMTQTFPMEQALGLDKLLKVDLRTLNWIGDMSDSNELYFTSIKSATKTLDDAKTRTTLISATGVESITSRLTALFNNMLGTKFKLVLGYPSGPDMNLAMQRGETDGRSVSNPAELAATPADAHKQFNFLVQVGLRQLPGYEDVPLLIDLAKNDDERRVFRFMSEATVVARPVVTNTGVPAERVAALRKAFDQAMHDPNFISDAKKQGMQVSYMSAGDLQRTISDVLGAAPDLKARVAEVIEPKDSGHSGAATNAGSTKPAK